jgi:hypothetical protein
LLLIAQVAAEEEDMEKIDYVESVLVEAWDNFSGNADPRLYAAACAMDAIRGYPLPEDTQRGKEWRQSLDLVWPDLKLHEDMPDKDDEGVIFTEDDDYEYFQRKGESKIWRCLKTPDMVRMAALSVWMWSPLTFSSCRVQMSNYFDRGLVVFRKGAN